MTRAPDARGKANGHIRKKIKAKRNQMDYTRQSCHVPFGPFAARMFAPASCLCSPAKRAGLTSNDGVLREHSANRRHIDIRHDLGKTDAAPEDQTQTAGEVLLVELHQADKLVRIQA